MKQDRVIFLDYLRGIACFLVMMVHASEAFYGVGDVPILSDAHKFWIAIWDGMSRISVPLFVITSAYLLVPMKEKQSWGEFFKRRFLRILPPMLVFMIVYAVLQVWQEGRRLERHVCGCLQVTVKLPDECFSSVVYVSSYRTLLAYSHSFTLAAYSHR